MSEPVVARNSPYNVDVEAGKSYAWCVCGRSATQPLCDGSHSGTDLAPLVWKAEKSGEVWFCGCKQTKGQPFCDGSHKAL